MTDSTSSMQIRTFSGFKSAFVSVGAHPGGRGRTGVDNTATAVHIVKPKQYLLRDLLHDMHRHALVLVSLDQPEQVLAQNLEHHADVRPIWTLVPEVVEEGDHMRTTGVRE